MARRGRTQKAVKPAVMAAGATERLHSGAETRELADVDSSAVAVNSQDEVEIVRRATEVLGINHVARWLQSQIPSLNNQTPYALMQTEEGRKQVERVLLRIEHGVY